LAGQMAGKCFATAYRSIGIADIVSFVVCVVYTKLLRINKYNIS